MGIKFEREGNQCEICEKFDTEIGKITYYTKHGDDLLLCSECLKKREKPYTEICPKCKRVAYEHGGMSAYGERPPFEDMCVECLEKKETSDAKIAARKLRIKNFGKDNWKFWITLGVNITVALIIIYFSYQGYLLDQTQFAIDNPPPLPTTEDVVIALEPGRNISKINFTKPFMLDAVRTDHDLRFELVDAKVMDLGSNGDCLYREEPTIDLRRFDSINWVKDEGSVEFEPEWFYFKYELNSPFDRSINPQKDVVSLAAGTIVFYFEITDLNNPQVTVIDEVYGSLGLLISLDDFEILINADC